MNSFLAWVGGKKALRDAVLARFPPKYDRYIEVFGGAGWVLFHKPPDSFEVFNDYNSLLVNLYRCVRDRPQELMHELQYVLNAREDFMYLAELHKAGRLDELPEIKRAACFYQHVRYSYGCGITSFASKPHSIWRDFPLIDRASHRLQSVVIENQDFEQLIRHYDSPCSFFYCDPPYYATEDYYMDVGFTKHDHTRLRNAVLSSQGKFLIALRFSRDKEKQIFSFLNQVEKAVSEHGFTARRMSKPEIKRAIGLYFGTSINGDSIPDIEGADYLMKGLMTDE